jgi:hypothetical protein
MRYFPVSTISRADSAYRPSVVSYNPRLPWKENDEIMARTTIRANANVVFRAPLSTDWSLFVPYEIEVPEIDNQSYRLPKDENRILAIDRICEEKN